MSWVSWVPSVGERGRRIDETLFLFAGVEERTRPRVQIESGSRAGLDTCSVSKGGVCRGR